MKGKVSSNWLIKIYLIVPLVLGICLIDTFLLNETLKPFLDLPIDSNRIFLAFFIFPHIVMSLFTLWDKEYWHTYKKDFYSLSILPYILLIPLGFLYQGPFNLIYLFLTIRHFLGQQMGVETLLANTHKVYSPYSKYFLLSIICIFYGSYALPPQMEIAQLLKQMKNEILFSDNSLFLISFFSIVILADAYLRGKHSDTKNGRFYVWIHGLSMVTLFFALKLGYPFLGLLIPRVVHDFTAITFYTVHDKNRNIEIFKNFPSSLISKFLGNFPLKLLILAILMVNIFWELGKFAPIIGQFFVLLGLIHYFVEGIIWKSGSLHRKQVTIV